MTATVATPPLPGADTAASGDISASGTYSVPVVITVAGIERTAGTGSLIALAIVVVDIGGVELQLQGVQIRRTATDQLRCQAPMFRHPASGRWLPCVVADTALTDGIGAMVINTLMDMQQSESPLGVAGSAGQRRLEPRAGAQPSAPFVPQ